MRVTTADLREATELLLAHLDTTDRSEIELAQDPYWDVSAPERYDLDREPGSCTIGQLSEDWAWLAKRLAQPECERDPIAYGLVWLGQVMRAIGEQEVR